MTISLTVGPSAAETASTSADVQGVDIMAILNITPDSFSDGGELTTDELILERAKVALDAGASILDIGGESTRPGATLVSEDDELERVIPAIRLIHQHYPLAVISIDTRKAEVAKQAIEAGASIVNDVSGLQFDDQMATVVAASEARLVIMHSQGTPDTMQDAPAYPDKQGKENVIATVREFFSKQIDVAIEAGVPRERLILDPGFGFGKTQAHNLTLLANLSAFQDFKLPILVGLSRKSFLSLPETQVQSSETTAKSHKLEGQAREAATAAAVALAIANGATLIRVHDVAIQAPAILLSHACLKQSRHAQTQAKRVVDLPPMISALKSRLEPAPAKQVSNGKK